VNGLRDLKGYDLIAQRKLVAHIRAACDAAQTSLLDHEQTHGCADVSSGATQAINEPSLRR
jgi:hypothetical protein